MLSCEETKNLLSAYYDGELGVAASEQVAQHLCSCEQCMSELEDMKALSKAVLSLDFPKADSAFCTSLHERLIHEAKSAKPKIIYKIVQNMRPYIAAAACLAIVVGIYTAVSRGYFLPKELAPNLPEITIDNDINNNDLNNAESAISQANEANQTMPAPDKKERKASDKVVITPVPVVEKTEKNTRHIQNKDEIAHTDDGVEDAENIISDKDSAAHQATSLDIKATSTPEVVEPKTNTQIKDGDDETIDSQAASTPSKLQQTSLKARFNLADKGKQELVIDVLKKYGIPEIENDCIKVEVLSANYDACVNTLRTVEGVDEYEIEPVGDSEHCYIWIDI